MAQKINAVIRWIVDLFFTFVLIVSVAAAAFVAFNAGGSGFNVRTFGIVQSRSMEASGLCVGDVVVIHRGEEYGIGDTIVFYRAPSCYKKPIKESDMRGVSLWVHEIVDIRQDELGRKTYLTKGTSNARDDGFYVPEDYVLGTAEKSSDFVRGMVHFLLSKQGIYTFIVTPSGILFVIFSMDLATMISEEMSERKEKRRRY